MGDEPQLVRATIAGEGAELALEHYFREVYPVVRVLRRIRDLERELER